MIGINKAGDHLVQFGMDLGLRIDVFKMEANPDPKIEELITKGEIALDIQITAKPEIVAKSQGSFQITQMSCKQLCLDEGVTLRHVTLSADAFRPRLMSL